MKPPPTAYSVAGTGRSSHWRGQAASVKSWSTPEAWVTASMMLEPMPGVSSPALTGSGRPTVYAGVEPRSDSSLRWEGRLLLARASAENRCDTLHPQRPPQFAVARRRGRRQFDADSARIGQGRRAGLASVAVNRVEAEASVIGRGERLQTRAGEGAECAAEEDRGQFAAVVTEQSQSMAAIHPTAGHRPRSGEQNR
jgi:hypothetical protein